MAEQTKRSRSIFRIFKHEGQEEPTSRSSPTVETLIFKYADESETRYALKDAFNGTLPPASVGRAAAAFGIATSAGNAGNTIESDDPADIKEAVEARLERFSSGEWSTDKGGEGRPSLLFEVLYEYRVAHKADVSDERMAQLRESFKADKAVEKRWMSDPDFRKLYEQRRMEKNLSKATAKADDLLQ